MYDSNKDQWSLLPELPYFYFSLVAVHDRKQLLAIGGTINNNGVYEVSNKVFLWDEINWKWTTPYPNMPTARFSCSCISHGSTVVVAGGMTYWKPLKMTRAVEVLQIKKHSLFSKSHWIVVEQLPHVVFDVIPLIVDDKLYLAVGHDSKGPSTCIIITASLPELLQSSNKDTSSNQVWHKLPDMPYSSFSINHYQGRVITFSAVYKVQQQDEVKPISQSVPLIPVYNPDRITWDCVGKIPHEYLLGRSVHIRDNKILFIGGGTGTLDLSKDVSIITSCQILTFY